MKRIFIICFLFFFLFLFSCSYYKEKTNSILEVKEKKVILALGDSLTAGYGVDEDENYPSKLQKMLNNELYDYEVVNGGVSGDTSANLLSRASLYIEKNPQIVILVIGGNDGLRGLSLDDLKQNIIDIIDLFPKSMIVLGGMDIPLNLGFDYRNKFRKIYQEIALERKEIYFLGYFLEGVAGKKDYNISDMIHPNSLGYDIIARNLFDFLKKQKLIEK